MDELLRRLKILIQNLATRVAVDRSEAAGGTYQVLWGGDRVSSGLEHLESQGLHFRAAAESGGVVISCGGQRDGGVLISVGGLVPNDAIGEGEGGLHYLGEWKLFLRSDGQLCLGSKTPGDWVALAAKTDQQIQNAKADISSILQALQTWVPVPQDGGAALKAAAASIVAHPFESVASDKVRCE
jgi:phage gp45-like